MAPLPSDAIERPVSRGRVVLEPTRLLPDYPDLQVEAMIENGFVDIVGGRFDAGLRLSEQVEPDLIAVRIGPVLGRIHRAPSYFDGRGRPEMSQEPPAHRGVKYRQSTSGVLRDWEFQKDGRALNVQVEGSLALIDATSVLEAASEGLGRDYVPEDIAVAPGGGASHPG